MENYWKESVLYWMEKLELLNQKQIKVMWKIQDSTIETQCFQDMGTLVNEIDIITKEMKRSVLEPNKNSSPSDNNEPLDLSVK